MRASTASLTVSGISSAPGGQHLDDEERVAVSLAVELVRVDAVRLGQLRDHGLGDSGASRSRLTGPRAAQLAEHHAERMRAIELVVAVARDDAAPAPSRPAGRAAAARRAWPRPPSARPRARAPSARRRQIPEHGGRNVVRFRISLHQLLQLIAGRPCDIEERTEGSRREQCVSGAPEDVCRRAVVLDEALQERRLSRTRFARDEHKASLRALRNRG